MTSHSPTPWYGLLTAMRQAVRLTARNHVAMTLIDLVDDFVEQEGELQSIAKPASGVQTLRNNSRPIIVAVSFQDSTNLLDLSNRKNLWWNVNTVLALLFSEHRAAPCLAFRTSDNGVTRHKYKTFSCLLIILKLFQKTVPRHSWVCPLLQHPASPMYFPRQETRPSGRSAPSTSTALYGSAKQQTIQSFE